MPVLVTVALSALIIAATVFLLILAVSAFKDMKNKKDGQ